jgi:hypothetical protein
MKEASKVVVIREAKLKDLGDMRGELSIRASVVDYKDDVIAQSQLPIYLNGVKIDTILSDGNGQADYL